MRFGVCTSPENAQTIKDAGFDYLELGVASHLKPLQPEGEVIPELIQALETVGLPAEAFNMMVSADVHVVGPDVDPELQSRYLSAAFKRAAMVGGKIVVFGSGNARRVPDGFDRATAETQIQEFLKRAGDFAGENSIVIAIEPLNHDECNILNSVHEAVQTAQRLAHPSVHVLSDLYHVAKDGQSYDETADAGPLLAHVHVAGLTGRMAPLHADQQFLADYFAAVKKAGYDQRISVEAGWRSLTDDAASCLQTLKAAWA